MRMRKNFIDETIVAANQIKTSDIYTNYYDYYIPVINNQSANLRGQRLFAESIFPNSSVQDTIKNNMWFTQENNEKEEKMEEESKEEETIKPYFLTTKPNVFYPVSTEPKKRVLVSIKKKNLNERNNIKNDSDNKNNPNMENEMTPEKNSVKIIGEKKQENQTTTKNLEIFKENNKFNTFNITPFENGSLGLFTPQSSAPMINLFATKEEKMNLNPQKTIDNIQNKSNPNETANAMIQNQFKLENDGPKKPELLSSIPIKIEIEPPHIIPQQQEIPKKPINSNFEEKDQISREIQPLKTTNHEEIILKNIEKASEIQKHYEKIMNKVNPQFKDHIEGEIKKGIGHLYGSSMLRLYETAEDFIGLFETYKRSEETIIFFARQLVKITMAEQVDSYIFQSDDKEVMRDRLGRISILFHFLNLHCPGLIDFVIGCLTEKIPLLIPKEMNENSEKNMKKIEYYSYLYFCIIGIDLNSFFSGNELKGMERAVEKKNQESENFREVMSNFLLSRDKMLRFLRNKGKIANFNEYFWKFLELFFKMPICEATLSITMSFCYASYFIWKKEGDKILKIMLTIKGKFLPKLKAFKGQIKDKNSFRINCNILEEYLENVESEKKIFTFEEKKEEN